MKKILIYSALFTLAAVSVQAQGLINFSNSSTTKIYTNGVVGGPAIAPTAPVSTEQYFYALYSSTTATTVLGATTNIVGGVGTNYAFYDTNWTLVAYGSNYSFNSGLLISGSASGNGTVTVSGVAGGSTANFVVVGWSGNIGKNISALQSWFNDGSPTFKGWIGQSIPSGPIILGTTTAATLFGTSSPEIPGFTLGAVSPVGPVAPVITVQPVDKTVAPGSYVVFTVSAYGTPNPTYQWMFDGTNVIAGVTGPSLTVYNVQASNAGTYSVVISNSAGSTNSYAATLTVTPPSTNGYVYFENYNGPSISKIYTNSAVGGPATGLTVEGPILYYYALYASATATNVLGQTSAILGSASSSYAFNDPNWTLVAYGTNTGRGQFESMIYKTTPTPTPGFNAGTTAQFVLIGWSVNVATNNISNVMSWFNDGSPASNGWIGQSAVSGAFTMGNGENIPVPQLFSNILSTNCLQGFTLGLASPTPGIAYTVPPAPPAVVKSSINANSVQLSWPTASGLWGVQSAPTPAGPWTDTGITNITAGLSNSTVTVPVVGQNIFFRLVAE